MWSFSISLLFLFYFIFYIFISFYRDRDLFLFLLFPFAVVSVPIVYNHRSSCWQDFCHLPFRSSSFFFLLLTQSTPTSPPFHASIPSAPLMMIDTSQVRSKPIDLGCRRVRGAKEELNFSFIFFFCILIISFSFFLFSFFDLASSRSASWTGFWAWRNGCCARNTKWSWPAAHTRASAAWLHLLSQHSVRRCLSLPGK